MGGDVETIKERLSIAEVVSGHVKLEKAGASFKGRCPFHSEKTPSFFVSPARQSFYCFGCGEKGDIFTFVEKTEGLEFREALKFLAEKAGVELERGRGIEKSEKDRLFGVLEEATLFFEKRLAEKTEAIAYLSSRGLDKDSIASWRLGYAPAEWRSLYGHLQKLGFEKGVIVKAGLAKAGDESAGKEPYDVFRDRIIFPLFDRNGRIIAFSGRAFSKDGEPKYLNSPDTPLFTKGQVLYGLDRAKDEIRRKNYAVLVEGQMDLVLSHQVGVRNAVAASGTAFGASHLERLRGLSSRIILAFDGDSAGEKAAEKASLLGLSLGFEVKLAALPEGSDPADLALKAPEEWREALRRSLPAVEFFFNKIEEREKDPRKRGKEIEKKILPMIKLVESSIEQAHFISLIARRTGLKEEVLWEDLKKAKKLDLATFSESAADTQKSEALGEEKPPRSRREQVEKRLAEINLWLKDFPESAPESKALKKEEAELLGFVSSIALSEKLGELLSKLAEAEDAKEEELMESLKVEIRKLHAEIRALEERKKVL